MKIKERILFASSAIRENRIEAYKLKKELKELLEEFENGNYLSWFLWTVENTNAKIHAICYTFSL